MAKGQLASNVVHRNHKDVVYSRDNGDTWFVNECHDTDANFWDNNLLTSNTTSPSSFTPRSFTR